MRSPNKARNIISCPYPCCSETPSQLCNDDECLVCLPYSFACHEKAKYFSDKNKDKDGNIIEPSEIFLYSHTKYIFKCDKSNHEFETSLQNITKHDSWCPYPCCNKFGEKLCDDKKCKICFNASFASCPKVKYFSEKNNANPRFLMRYSKRKFIFECKKKHEFESTLQNINVSWCTTCPFKNESYCKAVLEEITGVKFRKCRPKNFKKLELDGYNEELKLALEYNGEQHYKYVHKYYKNKPNALEKQQ